MSHQFYTVKINKIQAESPECVSITFDIPEKLKEQFRFKSGQYINLKKTIAGQELRRSYSICAAPDENELKVAVKKVAGGIFSEYANEVLKPGDEIEIMPPMGNFILPDDLSNIKNVVFYCAGSGITPVLSIIKTLLVHHPNINVILFYGNKSRASIIFRETLEGLKNLYLDRLSIHYILSKEMPSSPLFYGRIDKEKCMKFEKVFNNRPDQSIYYLCGPATMIFEVKACLESTGIQSQCIHYELFNTIGLDVIPNQTKKSTIDVNAKAKKIRMQLDGLNFEFDFENRHGNILNAALENGAQLPYACKGGVCSTCKAHCSSGKVEMAVNYALEADEIKAGYILTCQSYPIDDEVFINFDK